MAIDCNDLITFGKSCEVRTAARDNMQDTEAIGQIIDFANGRTVDRSITANVVKHQPGQHLRMVALRGVRLYEPKAD